MALLGVLGTCTLRLDDLHSSTAILELVGELVRMADMTPVGEPFVQEFAHWEGSAPSVFQPIEAPRNSVAQVAGLQVHQVVRESHVIVHTYPDKLMLDVGINSCKPISNPDVIVAWVVDRYRMSSYRLNQDDDWNAY